MKTFLDSFSYLSKKDKARFSFSVVLRVLIAIFDIAGLGLIGMAASLLSGAVINQNSLTGNIMLRVASLGLGANIYAIFALGAVAFFLGKSLLAILINKWVSSFVSSLESSITTKIFSGMLKSNLDKVEKLNPQEVLFGLQASSQMAFGTLFTSTSVIIGEAALIIAVSITLIIVNPIIFTCLAIYFGLVGVVMNQLINKRSSRLARDINRSSIRTAILTQDMLQGFRQVVTSGRTSDFVNLYATERNILAKASATTATLAALPRYITEIALMFGVAILLGLRSVNSDFLSPTVTSIFLAGAFRIIASMLPMQASTTAIRQATEGAKVALLLTKQYLYLGESDDSLDRNQLEYRGIPVDIEVANVTYRYNGAKSAAINSLSASFPANSITALLGKSGSGKSTLVDLILGLRDAEHGSVSVGGTSILDFRKANPRAVGYVPQSTPLFVGSLRENITMADSCVDEARLKDAIAATSLEDVIAALPDGLDTHLGEDGVSLSGGQRQRVGLARVFYQAATVLVFDESSSALDHDSVRKINRSIAACKREATVIVIAHSNSVLDIADNFLVMESGKVKQIDKAQATSYFESVKNDEH